LNIGLKTVEITLADDKVMLVKDLEFSKAAGSLSEIYNLVGNVDKDNFTAAEYLNAIFVDNAMRSQVDLANGVAMNDTKLVVNADATEGAAATVNYSYKDFSATPDSVVYKSTYTTWYGQTIIVNKTVAIDWTTYNYRDVEYYVYNSDDNYFSVPKATYINKPAESQSLADAYVSLDMNSAFNVVDKDGNVIDSHYETTSNYKVRNKVIVRPPAAPVAPVIPTMKPGEGQETPPAVNPETPVNPEIPVPPTDPAQTGTSTPSENPVVPVPDDVFWSEEGIL
jgi:hypothetical protein